MKKLYAVQQLQGEKWVNVWTGPAPDEASAKYQASKELIKKLIAVKEENITQ